MIVVKPQIDCTAMLPLVTSPTGLYREASVFFVGGVLPIYETLETMYESYCMAATELFYLTFGAIDSFGKCEEMARQIKKNFNVRLMARIEFPATRNLLERLYAAGVDMVEFPITVSGTPEGCECDPFEAGLPAHLQDAVAIFPEWSVAATLVVNSEAIAILQNSIDSLAKKGIMPMVQFSDQAISSSSDCKRYLLDYLVKSWKMNHVRLGPYLPLIELIVPLAVKKRSGGLRGVLDKIKNHHQVVSADLRRHLRVKQAKDSLDSAGL